MLFISPLNLNVVLKHQLKFANYWIPCQGIGQLIRFVTFIPMLPRSTVNSSFLTYSVASVDTAPETDFGESTDP